MHFQDFKRPVLVKPVIGLLAKQITVILERDILQWLESGALQVSLPAVCSKPVWGRFSEKYIIFLPSKMLGHSFNVCVLGPSPSHASM